MKILNIQAHPDDAECYTGGTCAKYAARGDTIEYLICTKGNRGTYDRQLDIERLAAIRKGEVQEAARILGVRQVHFLDGEDGFLYPTVAIRERIMEVVRRVRPDIVMTLDPLLPYEIHPDHRTVGMLAAEAAAFAGFPHFHPEHLQQGLEPWFVKEVWFYHSAGPNYHEDIGEFMEKKLAACYAHQSQIAMAGYQKKQVTGSPKDITELGREEFRKLAMDLSAKDGRLCGLRYAESFKRFDVRPGHLDLGS